MCGIFGLVSPEPLSEPQSLLEALMDRLAHRGPDGRGVYAAEGVFLGHRRLSIIDLEGGGQPKSIAEGGYIIVYNGELYNYLELRSQLLACGHTLRTHSDTEAVLAAFAQWGSACLDRLRGMFAFAVWDTEARRLFLARDRLGIKPLYYALLGQKLIFASEMKAITNHPEFARAPNLEALSSYLSFRTVLGEETVFAGLNRLGPGCCLHYARGQISLHRWWSLKSPQSPADRGEAFYLERLGELLPQIVQDHLVSDVPVGAYLSGGLDSSLLVALMARQSSAPINTYSIGYDVAGYDEGEYAQLVSRHLGTHHRRLTLSASGLIDQMEAMVRHRDQPLSIPHEAALLALSTDLRRDVTVCLSGEGADELFGGYGRVQRSPMDYRKLKFFQELPASLRKLIRQFVRDPDLAGRLGARDDVDHFLQIYHWWPLQEKTQLFSAEANQALQGDRAVKALCRAVFADSASTDPYDRVFHFFQTAHLPNLLDRLDMQSMAASVEARVPFVDHELVEFVNAIPLRYKMRWKSPLHMLRAVFTTSERASETLDVTKYLLRRLAEAHLPQTIVQRPKMGFPSPLDAWLNGPLRIRAREILLDPMTLRRGLFDPVALERLLAQDPVLEYDFHGKRIWMLMNVEFWFRAHIDQSGQALKAA